jgi:hypothetical protein
MGQAGKLATDENLAKVLIETLLALQAALNCKLEKQNS